MKIGMMQPRQSEEGHVDEANAPVEAAADPEGEAGQANEDLPGDLPA